MSSVIQVLVRRQHPTPTPWQPCYWHSKSGWSHYSRELPYTIRTKITKKLKLGFTSGFITGSFLCPQSWLFLTDTFDLLTYFFEVLEQVRTDKSLKDILKARLQKLGIDLASGM